MMNHAHFRIRLRQFVGDVRGPVAAAVVDDDDFEVAREALCALPGRHHQARDGPAVVVGRKKNAQSGCRVRAIDHQRATNANTAYGLRPTAYDLRLTPYA